jgi:hypothetical protein
MLLIFVIKGYNFYVKVLFSILLLLLYFLYAFLDDKYVKAYDKEIEGKNLIDFLNDREIKKGMSWKELSERSGIDPSRAYTSAKVNFRENPDIKSKVIDVLPKDTKVNIGLRFVPGNITHRKGDWIQLGVNGKIGWIEGHYLRPEKKSEIFKTFLPNINFTWHLIFPESTIKGKIIGVLIVIPISLIFDLVLMFLFGFRDEVLIFNRPISRHLISLCAPISYFLIKSNYFVSISIEELMLIFPIFLWISVVSSLPSMALSNLIEYFINKN